MNFRTIAPAATLSHFVKYFWILESSASGSSEKTYGAIVDGCPGIIMLQSEREGFCDEKKKKLPGIFLYGQTTEPVRFSAAGNVDVLGVCFQPHALKSVFGIDAHDLTSACTDVNHLTPSKQGKLSERLLNAISPHDQIGILSRYLIDRIQVNKTPPDVGMSHAVSQIIQSGGSISIRDIQRKLQQSERTLERKFKQAIGISPKLFSRICRFQHSLDQMRKSNYEKLSDIAYAHEYADQSHYIRVFKEFTGFTPLEFQKQTTEVVENFPHIAG